MPAGFWLISMSPRQRRKAMPEQFVFVSGSQDSLTPIATTGVLK